MFPYSCLSKKLPYSCLSKKLFNLRVEKEEGRKRIIAVAIDHGVSSQNALKWAIDHLVSRSTSHAPIKLVHVIHPSNSNNTLHATGHSTFSGEKHDQTDELLSDSNWRTFVCSLACSCQNLGFFYQAVIFCRFIKEAVRVAGK